MSLTMLETVTPEAVGLSSARLGRVTDLMRRYVDEGKLAGLVGVIWRSGAVAYAEAVGQRDIEAGTPMTLDTIFRIASMTKPITSVAALMLYEEGRFQLNDPISPVHALPNSPLQRISLEHQLILFLDATLHQLFAITMLPWPNGKKHSKAPINSSQPQAPNIQKKFSPTP